MKQAVISSEDRMEQKVKNIVRAEVAKVRVPLIPECPLPSLPGAANATQEDYAVQCIIKKNATVTTNGWDFQLVKT